MNCSYSCVGDVDNTTCASNPLFKCDQVYANIAIDLASRKGRNRVFTVLGR